MINKIIAISDINVRVYSEQPEEYQIGDIICTLDNKYKFEVVEINNNSITTIPLQSVVGLKRGLEVQKHSGGLAIEYSDNILGKVFNSYEQLKILH